MNIISYFPDNFQYNTYDPPPKKVAKEHYQSQQYCCHLFHPEDYF